jgi:hypothetical protein
MTEHTDGFNRVVVSAEPGGKLRIDCYALCIDDKWHHIYGGIHPASTFSEATEGQSK